MKVTIVRFRAFDRESTLAFIDQPLPEIHNQLRGICSTYETMAIRDVYTTVNLEATISPEALQKTTA